MNQNLQYTLNKVCKKENTTIPKWVKKTKVANHSQLYRLHELTPRAQVLQALCNPDNWTHKESSSEIAVACIKDFIVDKLGRSTEEFKINTTGSRQNKMLEEDLALLHNLAKDSVNAIELIHKLADIVRQTVSADAKRQEYKSVAAKVLTTHSKFPRKDQKDAIS